MLPLAFAPLFIGIPGFSIPLLHLIGLPVNRDGVNLSASIVVCVVGLWAWFSAGVSKHLSRHLTFCVLWLTASVVCGLFIEPGVENVLFYVQTLLPIFALGYGYKLVHSHGDIPRVIVLASSATAFFVVLIIVLSIWSFGIARLTTDRISVMREIAYAIPQFKSYYPMTVLATFSLTLAKYLFGKDTGRTTTLLLAAHALFIPLCWSRAGMLGFALCAAIQMGFAAWVGGVQSKQRTVVVTLLFVIVLPIAASKLGSTFAARTDVHDIDNRSDRKRLELFIEGCHRIAASPLFGDMFVPTWEERAGGEDIDVKRLFGAHNQYADWGLRGGVPYLVVATLFCLRSVQKCRWLASSEARQASVSYNVIGVGGTAYLASLLISSNFQLYMIQLQTAAPSYLILGMIERSYQIAKRDIGAMKSAKHQTPIRGKTRRLHSYLREREHRTSLVRAFIR